MMLNSHRHIHASAPKHYNMSCFLWLVLLVTVLTVGCTSETDNSRSSRARTAFVQIRIGGDTNQQLRALPAPQTSLRQRALGIPADVTDIMVHVCARGTPISGSPFPIPLDAATISLEIDANIAHIFTVEALNRRGHVIFRDTETVTLSPDTTRDITFDLEAIEVITTVASQPVHAATGGVVVVDDPSSAVQGLRLTIPPDALTQDTTITIAEVNNPQNTAVLLNQAGVIIDLSPNGLTFLQPITLEFPYTETLATELGLEEAVLRVYRFHPAPVNQWAPLPSQLVDTTDKHIAVQLASFSSYAVGGPEPCPANINCAPVANAQVVTTFEDAPVDLTLTGSDRNEDRLDYSIVTGPSHGILSGILPNVTYTPEANFTGVDTFSFTVHDGAVDSAPTVVTINVAPVNVTPVNDPPTLAAGQTFSLPENSATDTVVGTIAAIDPNLDDTLTYSISAGNTNGTFALDATTGQLTVANGSQLNFEATPSFILTITVTDAGGLQATATITIQLTNINEAPSITAGQSFHIAENSANGTVIDTVAASDPDAGDTLTFAISGTAFTINTATGQLTVADSTQLNLEATPSFSLTVTVTDTGGLQSIATLTIQLTNINEAPEATADSATVAEGGTMTTLTNGVTSILANDSDPEGNTLTVTTIPVSGPSNGTVTLNSNGTFSYTHDGSPTSSDSFTYQVCDNGIPVECATASVNISVVPGPTVRISPSLTSVAMDGVFTIRVTFDAMGVDIVSYFFELKFDQDIVVVQAVNGVASSPFDNPVTDSTTFSSGTVPFAANNSTVTPANGVFDVAELSLKAIGPAGSTSSLLLDVPFTGVIVSARDTNDDGQFDMFPLIPEPKITLEGGSVTIQ